MSTRLMKRPYRFWGKPVAWAVDDHLGRFL